MRFDPARGPSPRPVPGKAYGSVPATIVTLDPVWTTWMNVWPGTSVTGRPFESTKVVGALLDFLSHLPLIVLPLLAMCLARTDDVRLEALLLGMRVARERRETHEHDDDVSGRHALLVGLVDLGPAHHRAQVRIGRAVVRVVDLVEPVRHLDRAARAAFGERQLRPEAPHWCLGRRVPGPQPCGEPAELRPVREHVVGRRAVGDAPEVGRVRLAPARVVGVVDHLAASLAAQQRQRVGRPARVRIRRLRLGGPLDEVVARAAHGAQRARDLLLEHEHVARNSAFRGRVPDH